MDRKCLISYVYKCRIGTIYKKGNKINKTNIGCILNFSYILSQKITTLEETYMATLSNRVISIYNRKTSMRLAPAEWEAIDTICRRENIKRKKLFELIDANKDEKMGLTASVRVFSLIYYRKSFLSQMTSDASRS